MAEQFHATTVLCVRHRGQVAIAGDGQVTIGNTIVKAGARKVRKLHHDKVLAGFAGAAADAFTLFARFEAKLDEHRGNLALTIASYNAGPTAVAEYGGTVPPFPETRGYVKRVTGLLADARSGTND